MTDIKEIQNKLSNKLVNTGWYHAFRFFVNSGDMEDVLLDLYDQREENKRFSPAFNDLFKPFEICQYSTLKVVFICEEAYQDPTMNNGLAISINGPINYSPEFTAFQCELLKQVKEPCAASGDLTCWGKKGVLLYNTVLTCRVTQSGKHSKIWYPFSSILFESLNRIDDLVIVFLGDNPHRESLKNESHYIIDLPALPKEYEGVWDSQNVFIKINEILVEKNKEPIIW